MPAPPSVSRPSRPGTRRRPHVRTAVVLAVSGLVATLAAVWLALGDDVLAGRAVGAAHDAVLAAPLPPLLTEDHTRSACWYRTVNVRCAWTGSSPEEAATALVDLLRARGVDADPVVCDADPVPSGPAGPEESDGWACWSRAEVGVATLHVIATDVVPRTTLPLGRTAAWVGWDTEAATAEALGQRRLEALGPAPVAAVTQQHARRGLPPRYRELPCETSAADRCLGLVGDLDVADLGDDVAARLVDELTAEGFFVEALPRPEPATLRLHAARVLDRRLDPLVVVVEVTGTTATATSWTS